MPSRADPRARLVIPSHWPEYAIEAALLGTFMLSACLFSAILFYPEWPIARLIPDRLYRRVLMGLAMGATAVTLNYSAWGKRSGAHYNPAVTITFARLGKVASGDLVGYVSAQFVGGLGGVFLANLIIKGMLSHADVHYAVTRPGPHGIVVALLAEVTISFMLMTVVLIASNRDALASYTGCFAAALVATFIVVESPLSGMSMNPARTVASGFWAHDWTAVWIYFVAPLLGMLAAAEVYLRRHGSGRVFCAKLHHRNTQRCIFCEFTAGKEEREPPAPGTLSPPPAFHHRQQEQLSTPGLVQGD